ncbi:MAG: class I SAM-dependent methyltransferase [Planctomycetota bacterium]
MRKAAALCVLMLAVLASGCVRARMPLAGQSVSRSVAEAEQNSAEEKSDKKAGGWTSEKRVGRMIQGSETTLRPVYGPLAEYVVERFDLRKTDGVGIDLGSGPGTLIVELCRRTENLHWVNADINPHFFPYFLDLAEKHGFDGRVSAIRADAGNLPFRDNYAAVIVSRGSYHFWDDTAAGFSEIYRVLEPGGVAFIGRGLSPNLPPDIARKVRAGQKKKMDYDPQKKAAKLRDILDEAGVENYTVHTPRPEGAADVNYGLWAEIHKSTRR